LPRVHQENYDYTTNNKLTKTTKNEKEISLRENV